MTTRRAPARSASPVAARIAPRCCRADPPAPDSAARWRSAWGNCVHDGASREILACGNGLPAIRRRTRMRGCGQRQHAFVPTVRALTAAHLPSDRDTRENRPFNAWMPTVFRSYPRRSPPTVTVRDDVGIEAIRAADWDALAGGSPLVSHAFLRALHESGCASSASGWTPCYLTAWREGDARRRDAALRQGALLRRVRLRLGVGRCLSPLRPALLSEARRGDSFHAGGGPAALHRR